MRISFSSAWLVLALFSLFAALPVATAARAASPAPAAQTLSIHDVRTGDGPCGFMVERTVDGTMAIVPRIDEAGHLVLAIDPVELHGTLTNPATGKSVEMPWVRPNDVVDFSNDGRRTTVNWLLDGYIFRGYDNASTELTLALPADGAERVAFEPGQRSPDPWAHVCGMLS